MQPLDLNLASRPFRNNTLPWLATILGGVLLASMTAWNAWTWWEYRGLLGDLRDEVASSGARLGQLDVADARSTRQIAKHDLATLSVQARRANDIIVRKALSWTRLFNRLERVLPYNVRMRSIRPMFARQDELARVEPVPDEAVPVSVEGYAQDLKAFLQLERNLLHQPYFDEVEPERYSITDGGEVLFVLRFLYFPEGTTERELPNPEQTPASEDDSLTAPPGPGRSRAAELSAGVPSDDEAPADPGPRSEVVVEAAPDSVIVTAAPDPRPQPADAPGGLDPLPVAVGAAAVAAGAAGMGATSASGAAGHDPPRVPQRPRRGGTDWTAPTAEELERAKEWKPRVFDTPATKKKKGAAEEPVGAGEDGA